MISYEQITVLCERRKMRRNKPKTRTRLPRKYVTLDQLDVRGLLSKFLEFEPEWLCRGCGQEVRVELIGKKNNAYLRCPECRQILLQPNEFQIRYIREQLRKHLRDNHESSLVKDAG